MKAYIYQIRNTITNKRYIGSSCNIEQRKERHLTDLQRGIHHNIYLQRSYNKHGPEAFLFEVIQEHEIVSEMQIREVEQKYLDVTEWEDLYNIGKGATGGDNRSNHPKKDEITKKASETTRKNRARMSPEERSKKFGRHKEHNGMLGKTHTKEVREQLSIKGRIRNSSAKRLGKNNTELFGAEKAKHISEKLSAAGQLRTGSKNPFYGKKHTEDMKERWRIKRKQRHECMTVLDKLNHPQYQPILVNGRLFLGCAEAARYLSCTPGNVTYKLNSPKYSGYRRITKEEALAYLQTLSIMKAKDVVDVNDFKYEDFVVEDYKSHPTIKLDVAV
jgi:group I intron endonuclease